MGANCFAAVLLTGAEAQASQQPPHASDAKINTLMRTSVLVHVCACSLSWAGSPGWDLRPSVRISGAAASGSDIRVAVDSAVVAVAALQQHRSAALRE